MNKQAQKHHDESVPIFYYEDTTTTICLFLRQDGFVTARGIAVCSPLDQFVKRIGRAKALGMAVAAVDRKENSREINHFREPLRKTLILAAATFKYRSRYCPALTKKEIDIVKRVMRVSDWWAKQHGN